jgi:hypothetical protein
VKIAGKIELGAQAAIYLAVLPTIRHQNHRNIAQGICKMMAPPGGNAELEFSIIMVFYPGSICG